MTRKEIIMKNRHLSKTLHGVLSMLAAVSIVLGAVPMVFAEEGPTQGDILGKWDSSLRVDYTDYLNSDVMFRLPSGVSSDEEVSVIIKIGEPSLMDAYDGTDKTMSLQEYATTKEAKAVTDKIAARKAEILSLLDEQGVEYTTGEDYNALFSGFELLVKAGDYAVTCMSLGSVEKAILS